MRLGEEQENFVKLTTVIVDILPYHLRQVFRDEWRNRFPGLQWTNDAASGLLIYNQIPKSVRNNKKIINDALKDMILLGKVESWDPTALFFLLLFSGLNLVGKCRPKGQRNPPLEICEHIDRLREIRSFYFAHVAKMSWSNTDFTNIMGEIKTIFRTAFGSVTVQALDDLINSRVETQLSMDLQCKLDEQENLMTEFESIIQSQEKTEKGLQELKDKVEDLEGSIAHERQREPDTEYERQVKIDKVKERYSDLCNRHMIHGIKRNRMQMKWWEINKFAVKLRIARDPEQIPQSFRDEREKNVKELNCTTSYDIDMTNLINDANRVTFVRGVPGAGKSVLAKQIVYGWADGSMYKNFDVCLFIKCSELNRHKVYNEDGSYSKEKLELFIAKRLYDLKMEEGENMFLVIDGADELPDIKKEKDSLLCHFIDTNEGFRKSKIIITGRPHVESVLERTDFDIGGLRVVEIMGLGTVEIEEYVTKFIEFIEEGRSDEYRASIKRTIEKSNDINQILCVPQFLNSVCCVSILNGGKEIRNETELYSWILYLLLKQHCFEREEAIKKATFSIVFLKYRKVVLLLSKICFQLYSRNRVVFSAEDFKQFLDNVSIIEREIVDGLLVDVSDDSCTKFQFKHLSLMEYLSAIHICTLQEPSFAIEQLLSTLSFKPVLFACGLYGGILQDRIVHGGPFPAPIQNQISQDLFKCVIELDEDKRKTDNYEYEREVLSVSFFTNALQLIQKTVATISWRFSKLCQVIVEFLSVALRREHVIGTIASIFASFGRFYYTPNEMEQRALLRLVNILKKFEVDKVRIKGSLKEGTVCLSYIYDIECISVVQYFGEGAIVKIENIKIDERAMNIIKRNLPSCKEFDFRGCEFEDRFIKTQYPAHKAESTKLTIAGCRFDSMRSFKTISQWAVFFDIVRFEGNMDISREFWETFGNEIDEANSRGLTFQRLEISDTMVDESSWEGELQVMTKFQEVMTSRSNICKEWLVKLVNVIRRRNNDGSLKLKCLELVTSFVNEEDTWRSIEEYGVEVNFLQNIRVHQSAYRDRAASMMDQMTSRSDFAEDFGRKVRTGEFLKEFTQMLAYDRMFEIYASRLGNDQYSGRRTGGGLFGQELANRIKNRQLVQEMSRAVRTNQIREFSSEGSKSSSSTPNVQATQDAEGTQDEQAVRDEQGVHCAQGDHDARGARLREVLHPPQYLMSSPGPSKGDNTVDESKHPVYDDSNPIWLPGAIGDHGAQASGSHTIESDGGAQNPQCPENAQDRGETLPPPEHLMSSPGPSKEDNTVDESKDGRPEQVD